MACHMTVTHAALVDDDTEQCLVTLRQVRRGTVQR